MATGVDGTGALHHVPPVVRQPQEHPQHGRLADEGGETAAATRSLEQVVEELNASVQALNSHLAFSVDSESGKTVVRVIDGSTGEVIRQIPPEATLHLAAHIRDLLGILLDEEA